MLRLRHTLVSVVIGAVLLTMWWMTEPSVISVGPLQIDDVNAPITITFDKPVKIDSVEQTLALSPTTGISLNWISEQELTIAPLDNWEHGQSYELRLGPLTSPWGKQNSSQSQWTIQVNRPASITLTLLGDILLAELPSELVTSSLTEPSSLFDSLADGLLQQEDLVLGNLESPISTRGSELKQKSYRFSIKPHYLPLLTAAKLDAVSIANNHSLDFGPQALTDTPYHLAAAGIETVGFKEAGAETVAPTIINHQGYRVGIVAYVDKNIIPYHYRDIWQGKGGQAGVMFIDDGLAEEITALKAEVDFVVVSLHWGLERMHLVTKEQRSLAHQLIEAGADVIMGHHPHVAQGVERYQKGLIFYSLGNFVFPPTDEHLRSTFVPKVELRPTGEHNAVLYPIKPVNGKPHSMTAAESAKLFEQVNGWSAPLQTSIELMTNAAGWKVNSTP